MALRVVGVYDTDGSFRAELASLVGRARGGAGCALGDITQGRVRRRKEFDRACEALPAPIELLHRDEVDEGMRRAIGGELPCVAAVGSGGVELLLGPDDLEACAGDPERFVDSLLRAIGRD